MKREQPQTAKPRAVPLTKPMSFFGTWPGNETTADVERMVQEVRGKNIRGKSITRVMIDELETDAPTRATARSD